MPEASTSNSNKLLDARGRDTRLDFWRGLCLIDMILVHLIYANVQFGDFVGTVLTDYTRFAAGGFVFLSGMLMGVIFLPKAISQSREKGHALLVYQRVWARSFKLLIVQYVSTTTLMLLNVPTGSRAAFAHPLRFMKDLLQCRTGNDLLMLYVGMLAVTPLLLEMLRFRLWPIIAIGSAALFAYGTRHPWRIAFVHRGEFPVLLWQAVFISGLLFTYALRAFDKAARRARIIVIGCLAVAFLVLFQSANTADLGLGRQWLRLKFWKIPLTFGEYLRYLVTTLLLMLGTNIFWGKIKDGRVTAFIRLLGRNSLLVYVAHLYVQEAVAALAYRTWDIGPWQAFYGLAMIAVLGLLAYVVERFNAASKIPKSKTPSSPPTTSSQTGPSSFAVA